MLYFQSRFFVCFFIFIIIIIIIIILIILVIININIILYTLSSPPTLFGVCHIYRVKSTPDPGFSLQKGDR